ncbi:MAG: 2-dehydropantoate 2-reductase [Proteobacteria bacterium]|nr:2-dehydropantoate 2-reductase [Pseudomonadota bacterium]
MKICIVGAGAIGGFLGTRLAITEGIRISALARGATLAALRTHGWRLHQDGMALQAPAIASDDPAALGIQDLVVIAVKGQSLPPLAASLAPLIGPDTIILPALNGVPWWFSESLPSLRGRPLESVDPGGAIARVLPLAQIVGCVVHVSTSTPEPGLVEHKMGRGLIVGEPDGGESERVSRLAALFSRAGFELTCSSQIHYDVWYKLWGNMTANPVSALTGATMDRVLDDDLVREFCAQAMREAGMIGTRIGCPIDQTPADRMAITSKLGAFRTSMLQDAQAGRTLELDALIGSVREIGQRVGVKTPTIDALFGLARLFGRTHGLYP